MRRAFAFISLFVWLGVFLQAQELNCKVTVSASQLNNADLTSVFKTYEKSVMDFMNNTIWTDRSYEPNEKIECVLFINVTSTPSQDAYTATVNLQTSRPIFNSTYTSTCFNFIDKDFQFEYKQFDPLDYNPNGTNTNLVNVLATYAYLIIGYDDDTYSSLGGSDAFGKAEVILNQIDQNKLPDKGWSINGTTNRYTLIKEMVKPSMKEFREALYSYYIQGFDKLYDNTETSRNEILASVERFAKAYDANVNSFSMQILVSARGDEICNLFYPASKADKDRIFKVLSKIDAANTAKYHKALYDLNKE